MISEHVYLTWAILFLLTPLFLFSMWSPAIVNISHSSSQFYSWLPSHESSVSSLHLTFSFCYYSVFLKHFSEKSYCPFYLFVSWLLSTVSFMSREEDSCTVMRYGLLFGLVPHFVQHQWSFGVFFYGGGLGFIQSLFIGSGIKKNMGNRFSASKKRAHVAATGTH